MPDTLAQRLERYSEPSPSGCWEWTGYKDRRGYGRLNINRSPRLAHRVCYELLRGPETRQLHHTCENPACINPDHLEPVTPKEHRVTHMELAMAEPCARCGHTDWATQPGHGGHFRYCRECNRRRARGS